MPVNRLLQSQEILISKLAKYLHLLNVQSVSVQNEDVDKLVEQIESGRIINDEIVSLNKVAEALYNDFNESDLFTDEIRIKYDKNKSECADLVRQIENAVSANRDQISRLREKYRTRIEAIEKNISPEIKVFNTSSFSSSSSYFDQEA